jgi:hemerythrin-like domain-containing protein
MCSYCGCQSITVIGRFMAEHDSIIDTTGLLRRAALRGDQAAAGAAAANLHQQLEPHTNSEERSLFAELRLDPEFTDHVDDLCREHAEIGAGLAKVIDGDFAAIGPLELLLRHHIDREDNGLFPAAAIALGGPAWERVVERAG